MDYIKAPKEEQAKILREKSLDELREIYRPLAESVASRYDADPEIALRPFERARRLYLKNKCDERFKFSTYLTWFMKEACEGRL